MKRAVYNASFEESQNLVTEKYIKSCIDNSKAKVICKRTLGIILVLALVVGVYYSSFAIERYSVEESIGKVTMIQLSLGFFWNLMVGCITSYYIVLHIMFRRKVILKHHIFSQTIMYAMSLFFLILTLLLISIANQAVKSIWPSLIYLVLGICLLFYQFILYKERAFNNLYVNTKYKNAFSKYYNSFIKFAKRYGVVLIILSFVIKKISNHFLYSQNDFSLIQQAICLAMPVFLILGVIFIFHLSDELMQGYYLRKYYEQYRLKYNDTTKQWYGEKSKQYKQAKANGEEE